MDLLLFTDDWGLKLLVPYILENDSPKIFNLNSRNLRSETWIFPLERTILARLIDNKVMLANALFEFVFLTIHNRLVLMALQLELENPQTAFEIIQNESFEVQLAAAKAFCVHS